MADTKNARLREQLRKLDRKIAQLDQRIGCAFTTGMIQVCQENRNRLDLERRDVRIARKVKHITDYEY